MLNPIGSAFESVLESAIIAASQLIIVPMKLGTLLSADDYTWSANVA